MRPRLLDLLVCPIDKTPLKLVAWESREAPLSGPERERADRMGIDPGYLSREIETGILLNRERKICYPIVRGVPRMLVFRTDVGEHLLREFGRRLRRESPGFEMPRQDPMPGEGDVLRTFSREWLDYEWDGCTYWNLNPYNMDTCMYLMLDIDRRRVRDKMVLEMGIGIGGIADHVSRRGECELVGVDLSYAVDAARKYFGGNRFLHIVQASVFAPPFREGAFDFVYSQGVIHHTFSTKAAFDRLCRLAEDWRAAVRMGLQPRGRATQLGPSEPDAPGVGDPAHLLATAGGAADGVAPAHSAALHHLPERHQPAWAGWRDPVRIQGGAARRPGSVHTALRPPAY